MKIREGFVSNSSSSSFIILGKSINISDVNLKMIKEREIMAIGDDLSEGMDVFKIRSEEQLAFLKALNKIGESPFIIVDSCAYNDIDGFNGNIQIKNIPEDGKLEYYRGESDFSSSYNVDLLIERYDDYGKVEQEMQKFLRGKKINKIEKSE